MKLNDTKCKNAKPLDPPATSPRKLADGDGLYLWIYPDGAKRWRFDYRLNGKRKVLSIGIYPEISLKEARDKKIEARKLVAEGKDPSLEKKRTKLLNTRSSENTFEKVAHRWIETKRDTIKPRYAEGIMSRLEKDIFPFLGDYPIKDIEPPMLLQVIRKIESRGANEIAKRQLQKCGEIFKFAISEGSAVRDPSSDIKGALKQSKVSHYASIESKELPEFIEKIEGNKARLYENTINALKLMMLTFVRTNELINATWDEIDLEAKEWIIPAERMKMKREHFVPLSKQSIIILQKQKETGGYWEHVFPSSVRPRNAMSNNTILGALKRLGYQGKMTGHGFRSLAMSTIMEELGYRFEVPDLQLAHAKGGKVRQAYDRTKFKDERIKMMQEWADYLESKGLRC
ncbi:MAG: integrase arm-type DNA-binding domain-containing protein [Rickettsiales bacterium]